MLQARILGIVKAPFLPKLVYRFSANSNKLQLVIEIDKLSGATVWRVQYLVKLRKHTPNIALVGQQLDWLCFCCRGSGFNP